MHIHLKLLFSVSKITKFTPKLLPNAPVTLASRPMCVLWGPSDLLNSSLVFHPSPMSLHVHPRGLKGDRKSRK